jgi:VWFA-related protein
MTESARMRWAGCLLAGLASAAAAQEPKPPTFKADTALVTVDVVVTGSDGEPVRGLTQEDFVIRDEGRVQTLTTFEAVERAGNPAAVPAGDAKAPSLAGAPDRDAPPPIERPLLVFVFDEPHLTPAGIERARRRLSEASAKGSLGSVEVYLISTERSGGFRLGLPEGQDEVTATLARFRGRRMPIAGGRMNDQEAFLIASRRQERTLVQVFRRYIDLRLLLEHPSPNMSRTRGSNEGAMLSGGDGDLPAVGRAALQAEAESRWNDIRTHRAATLRGLSGLMQALGARRERKAVVLVSEGFVNDPAQPEHRELVEASRLAHAGIHFLDVSDANPAFSHDVDTADTVDIRDAHETFARAVQTADGTKALALTTGGRVLHDSAGLAKALGRIAGSLRSYYLVGYAPQRPPDGRYHKLKVELRRPGLKVEARPGYYAISRPDPPGPDEDGLSAAASAVRVALDSPFDASDLPVHLASYVLGPKGDRARIRLVAELDGQPASGPVDAVFQLTARGRDETLQRALEASSAAGRPLHLEADFEALPGAYQAQVVLRKRKSGRIGSVRQAVDVLPDEAFRTSTPVLTDTVVGSPPNVSPVARADRRFVKAKDLYCYVEVGGASADAPVLAGLDLLEPTGKLRLRVPASPLTAGQRSRLWAVPLADLEPGPYELLLSVHDTGTQQGLQRREPFEVLGP